jgi:hypothetical protein
VRRAGRRAALCPFQTGARPCRIPPPPPLLTPAASPRSPLLRPAAFVAQKTGDKVWVKAGHEGDALTVELLLKKQDSGLWRAEKLVVSTPEPVECLACAAACARCSCPTDHSCCEECVFGHSLLPAVCSSPDTCSDERTCQPHWWYTLFVDFLFFDCWIFHLGDCLDLNESAARSGAGSTCRPRAPPSAVCARSARAD